MTQASRTPRTRRSAKAETAPAAPAPKVTAAAPPKPRTRTKAAPAPVPAPVVDLRATAPIEEQIALAAYLMWEQGQPGDAAQHWFAAERLVRA